VREASSNPPGYNIRLIPFLRSCMNYCGLAPKFPCNKWNIPEKGI